MLVYRTVSSNELLNLIDIEASKNANIIKGQNTFKYEKGKTYIHFFKYEEHALYYMKKRNNPIIIRLDIPDDILGNIEYGFYGDVDTYYDDCLYGYYMPLPEYVIPIDKFKKEYIIDFSYNGVWQDPLRYNIEKEFFWVEKEYLFHDKEMQAWTTESIYYEYVKIVSEKYKYNMDKVASYLKTINLDEELDKVREKIKKEKIMTKRKFPRRNF
jgi:hypothetical protein